MMAFDDITNILQQLPIAAALIVTPVVLAGAALAIWSLFRAPNHQAQWVRLLEERLRIFAASRGFECVPVEPSPPYFGPCELRGSVHGVRLTIRPLCVVQFHNSDTSPGTHAEVAAEAQPSTHRLAVRARNFGLQHEIANDLPIVATSDAAFDRQFETRASSPEATMAILDVPTCHAIATPNHGVDAFDDDRGALRLLVRWTNAWTPHPEPPFTGIDAACNLLVALAHQRATTPR